MLVKGIVNSDFRELRDCVFSDEQPGRKGAMFDEDSGDDEGWKKSGGKPPHSIR